MSGFTYSYITEVIDATSHVGVSKIILFVTSTIRMSGLIING